MQKILPVLLFFLLFSGPAVSQDTVKVTLDEAVKQALLHNENLKQTYLNYEIAEEQYQNAWGQYLPNISLSGNYTRNIKLPVFFLADGAGSPFGGGGGENFIEVGNKNSYNANLQGNTPIFNLALIRNIDMARINTELAAFNIEAESNELKAQVRTAFFDVLAASSLLDVQNVRFQTTQENLNLIEDQFREGITAEYDYLRAQVNLENIRPNITEAYNNYYTLLNQLKVLMGMSIDTPLQLTGSLTDYVEYVLPENLEEYSVSGNPDLHSLRIQQRIQEAQVSVQKAAYYPSLSGFGNYQYQAQADDFNFSEYNWVETSSAGLSLSWTLFQGLTRRNDVQIAEINQNILEEQYSLLNRNLEAQAETALNTLSRALENMQVQQRNVELAERAYGIARISYQNGVSSLIELNDAELALAEARVNYLSSVQQYLNSLVEYQRLIGEDIINFTAE